MMMLSTFFDDIFTCKNHYNSSGVELQVIHTANRAKTLTESGRRSFRGSRDPRKHPPRICRLTRSNEKRWAPSCPLSGAPYLSAGATIVGGFTAKSHFLSLDFAYLRRFKASPQPRRACALWGSRREPCAHGVCMAALAPHFCSRLHVARRRHRFPLGVGACGSARKRAPTAILYALLRRAAFSLQSLAG